MPADLADAGGPEVLEDLDGGAVEEPALGQRPSVTSEIASTSPPPRAAIWSSAPFQGEPGDPLSPVGAVGVDARDAPVGARRRVLAVGDPVLDRGQLLGVAVLRPSLGPAFLVEDQRGVGTARESTTRLAATLTVERCTWTISPHRLTGDVMRSRTERSDGRYVLTREQRREALKGARALLRTMEEREAAQRAAVEAQTARAR